MFNNGQIEDPYLGDSEPRFRVQCNAPVRYSVLERLVGGILGQIITRGDLIVHITDWNPPTQCSDFLLGAMRHEFREMRRVEHAPGFLVPQSERELAIAVFVMMTCFEWKGYVYGSHDQITLSSWEGEILDFWTESEAKRDEFRTVIRAYGLEEFIEQDENSSK